LTDGITSTRLEQLLELIEYSSTGRNSTRCLTQRGATATATASTSPRHLCYE